MPPPTPPIGPFIPADLITDEKERAALVKRAFLLSSGLALAVTSARVFPESTAFATKALTGVQIGPGRVIKPTPLVVTWLFPFPVGAVPPSKTGLQPDWYLPGALALELPNVVPGVQHAKDKARFALENATFLRERNEFREAATAAKQRSTQAIIEELNKLQTARVRGAAVTYLPTEGALVAELQSRGVTVVAQEPGALEGTPNGGVRGISAFFSAPAVQGGAGAEQIGGGTADQFFAANPPDP